MAATPQQSCGNINVTRTPSPTSRIIPPDDRTIEITNDQTKRTDTIVERWIRNGGPPDLAEFITTSLLLVVNDDYKKAEVIWTLSPHLHALK